MTETETGAAADAPVPTPENSVLEASSAPPAAETVAPEPTLAAAADEPSTVLQAPEVVIEKNTLDIAISQEAASSIIDRWFSIKFPGSVVAETTDQWNFMVGAKEELKVLLAGR